MSVDHARHLGERRPRASHPLRRHRVRVWIVVAIFLGFVGLAWAWAFQRGPSHGAADVPLLAAGQLPTREKPTDPGGLKVADIDPLAYDSGRAPPRVENILPAPETPLPQPMPDPKPVAVVAPPAPAPADAAPSPPVQMANADAAPARAEAAPDAVPPPKPVMAMATPKPAPRAPAAPPAKPMLKAKPAALREEAKPHPKPLETTGPSGYRVQLVSVRSASDAQAAEVKLRRSYGDVLSAVGIAIVPVNLGSRGTFYRVMAGPMKQGAASHLCDTLRQRGAVCLLAKP